MDNLFQFEAESKNINITLPLTDTNLEILISIIQGIKVSENHDDAQNIVSTVDAPCNQLISESDTNQKEQDYEERLLKPGIEEKIRSDLDNHYRNLTSPIFSEENILARNTDGMHINIYKPIVDYIKKKFKDIFTKRELITGLHEYYNKTIERPLKLSSAQVYGGDYLRYFEDNGLIQDLGDNQYKFIEDHPKKTIEKPNTGRSTIEKEIKGDIVSLYEQGYSTGEIKREIEKKHHVIFHRNTIRRYKPESLQKKTKNILLTDEQVAKAFNRHKERRIREIRDRRNKHKHMVKGLWNKEIVTQVNQS